MYFQCFLEDAAAEGRFDDETIFGNIRFNRFNQNTGRSSISWQVLEDGAIRMLVQAGLG